MLNNYNCVTYSQGKLIIKLSFTKVVLKSSTLLERIHGDICGPIHPPCGLFQYFILLIYVSIGWSHVCFLSTHNVAFAMLLTQKSVKEHNFQITLSRKFVLIMRVNFHSKLLLTFICQLELTSNILMFMFIIKMV